MANISQITLPNSNTYTIKDPIFRGVNNVTAPIFATSTAYRKYDMFWSGDVLYVVLSAIAASNTKSAATLLSDGVIKSITIGKNFGDLWEDIAGAIGRPIRYVGFTTTPLSDGATTNPIIINGNSYSAKNGDLVIYQASGGVAQEFLFDGTKWEEFGSSTGTFGALAYLSHVYYDKTTKVTYDRPSGATATVSPTTKYLAFSGGSLSGTTTFVTGLKAVGSGSTTTNFVTGLKTGSGSQTTTDTFVKSIKAAGSGSTTEKVDAITALGTPNTGAPSWTPTTKYLTTSTLYAFNTSKNFKTFTDSMANTDVIGSATVNDETLVIGYLDSNKLNSLSTTSYSPFTGADTTSTSGTAFIASATWSAGGPYVKGYPTPTTASVYKEIDFNTNDAYTGLDFDKTAAYTTIGLNTATVTFNAATLTSEDATATGRIGYVSSVNSSASVGSFTFTSTDTTTISYTKTECTYSS